MFRCLHGEEKLLDCLERNEKKGIVYHRGGINGECFRETNISSTDLLGCINDYCENQSFNTIIVANEQKIKDSSDNELSYHEIKEKIVQRVIQFVPDYGEVVSNSIELMSCGIEYKGLLRRNKKLLVWC